MVSKEELKAKKKQAAKMKYLGIVQKEMGHKCVNCGSTEHIEYHHIVPLQNGGTNALSNIVPLCQRCHYLAHDKTYRHIAKTGRKKVPKPDNFDEVAARYNRGEITWKEGCELTHLDKNKFFYFLHKNKEWKSGHKKQAKHFPKSVREARMKKIKKER